MIRKITLEENEIPDKWYNIVADMPNKPLPPLNPGTLEPIGPEALAPLFPMELIKQEVSPEKWIDIPDEVRNIYSDQTSNRPVVPKSSQVRNAFVRPDAEGFIIKCNLHPFLQTHGFLVENPYYTVTDSNGNFSIENIPPVYIPMKKEIEKQYGEELWKRIDLKMKGEHE